MRIFFIFFFLVPTLESFGQLDIEENELTKLISSKYTRVMKIKGSSLREEWLIDTTNKIIVQGTVASPEMYPYAPKIEEKYAYSCVRKVYFSWNRKIDSIVKIEYAYQYPKSNEPYFNDTSITIFKYWNLYEYPIGKEQFELVQGHKVFYRGEYFGYNNYGELQVSKYSDSPTYEFYKHKNNMIKALFDGVCTSRYYFDSNFNIIKFVSTNRTVEYEYRSDNLLESQKTIDESEEFIRFKYE